MKDITKNENYIDIKERFKKSNKYMLTIDYTDIKFLFYYIDEQQKEIEEMREELQMYVDTNLIDKQQKEIEEKTTIIAGAEKVKQLEKEIQRLEKDNDTLSELVIVNEDKVINELDLISKDKIREKIKEYDNEKYEYLVGRENIIIALNELLEE